MFWRLEPNFVGDHRDAAQTEQGRRYKAMLDHDWAIDDIAAVAARLKSMPDCNGRIGVTGFCYGGSVSNQLAARMGDDLAAAVPFYGGGVSAEEARNISAAIMVMHGALDTRLVNAWPDYDAALSAAGVTHEGHIYPGAVHGFFNDATPERYNAAAAEDAWERMVGWFNTHVRG